LETLCWSVFDRTGTEREEGISVGSLHGAEDAAAADGGIFSNAGRACATFRAHLLDSLPAHEETLVKPSLTSRWP
jgi:hypothetical protein